MHKFILFGLLLISPVALAEYSGELNMELDASVLAKSDAGVGVVTMTALAVTGSIPDAGAALVAPSLDAPLMSAKGFYTAVKTGNGWLAAMFLLFFLVGAIRIVGKRVHAMIPDDTKHWLLKPVEAFLRFVFDTKIGGWLLNWLSAVGGCLSTAAMAGMPVDAASWKVAILASTGGTALIELKDDVMEWWDKRQEAAKAEVAAKAAVVAPTLAAVPPPAIPPVEPPKP